MFAALSPLIFLLFVALTFVLLRNLLKLFAERRLGVLGSKFRTRMVAGALLLSFVPVMVMYWFCYGLMNRSIDKWFSTPVEEVRADTHAMASLLGRLCGAKCACRGIGDCSLCGNATRILGTRIFSGVQRISKIMNLLCKADSRLLVQDGNAEASFNAPAPWPLLKSRLPLAEAARCKPARFKWEQTRVHSGQRSGWR